MNRISLGIIAVIILLLAATAGYYLYQRNQVSKETVYSPSPAGSPLIGFNATASATPGGSPLAQGASPAATPGTQPTTGSNTQEVKNIGISLSQPKGSDRITSPTKVIGSANVYEGQVVIQVKDANGKVLGQGTAIACMDLDACPFQATISFEKPTTTSGTVEAYSPSGRDGSPQYLQTVLVRF